MKTARLLAACATLLSVSGASASTITPFVTPTNADESTYTGVPYRQTITLAGTDSASFLAHCGAWSWDENASVAGDPTFGWTHTSVWTAIELTAPAYLTVKMAANANVPWPSAQSPDRKAATNAMFPSFSIYKHWDTDNGPEEYVAKLHQYSGRANVLWAEDLTYYTHVDNSATSSVERTYALLPGKYTIVQGSNAVTNDSANRQGYQLDLTTAPYSPPSVGDDSYFTLNHSKPLSIPAAAGLLANDLNVAQGYTLQMTKQPAKGKVTVSADGSFTYVPGAYYGEAGFDTFAYKMVPNNGNEGVGPATVAISTFASAAGQYTGLLLGGEAGTPSGLVKLSLTATGKYTGTAWVADTRYALSGQLSTMGETEVKAKPSLAGMAITLASREDGASHLTTTLPLGGAMLTGEIEQSPFSRFQAAPMAGTHKVIMIPALPETPDPAQPTANGSATLKIGPNGGATLIGKLGDKTPFSVQTGLIVGTEVGPTLPVYAPMYKKLLGTLAGKLVFGPAAEDTAAGTLRAVKPDPGFTLDYLTNTIAPTPAKVKKNLQMKAAFAAWHESRLE